jgi:N-formylglutamate deformylase
MISRKSILIHIPHSSLLIPESFRSNFVISDSDLANEMLLLTDRYVDELFDLPGVVFHMNPVSRVVMDPERFRSDKDEPMSKKGMGLAYTHTSHGRLMRNLTQQDHEKILAELYDPYHAALTDKTDRILDETCTCFIIDAHSFPSLPLPFEDDQKAYRPDICLGYEPFHIDAQVLRLAERYFMGHQLTVAHNIPFAGSIVPMKYYRKDSRVQSLMIEVNRALYMDEKTGGKLDAFAEVRDLVKNAVELLEDMGF